MTEDGRAALKRFSHRLLTAFLRSADAPALTAKIPAFLEAPTTYVLLNEGFRQLHQVSEADLVTAQRGDPFQRLLAHPLSDAFVAEELPREILPGYFSFLHLVLGDARETLGNLCIEILAELKGEPFFSWDAFYDDPRSKEIFWTVLVRIADSFKRFELRRDWFIGLMQNRPHAVSLSSHSFLPTGNTHPHPVEEAHVFGLEQFNTLFRCLYGPLRDLSPVDRDAFRKTFGTLPEQVFQAVFKNLG